MILPYQRYKNISGKVLQWELRLSEGFCFHMGETIKLLEPMGAEYNHGYVEGHNFEAIEYKGAYEAYRHGWVSDQFIKDNFELQPYPIFKTQMEMFDWIFEDRPHRSQLTNNPLHEKGHMQWHQQFMHVLNKGQYTYWKFNPENILLGTPEEHDHQTDYPYFNTVHLELKSLYNQQFK